MSRILRIGLTGGIGAGKTTVAQIFEVLGIPIYYADQQARLLMETDADLIMGVKKLLGEESYSPEGKLNRAYVAKSVFTDHNQLTRLNFLVHPIVARDAERWHKLQSVVPFTIREAALTFESGSYLTLDAVISVEAPEDVRTARVTARDQVDQAAVRARMDNQWPEDRRQLMADYLIDNDGNQFLIPQVITLFHKLSSW